MNPKGFHSILVVGGQVDILVGVQKIDKFLRWTLYCHDFEAISGEGKVLHDKVLGSFNVQRKIFHNRGCPVSFEDFLNGHRVERHCWILGFGFVGIVIKS